jgi:hypothetical protein
VEEGKVLSEAEKVLMGEQVYTLKGCGACHKTGWYIAHHSNMESILYGKEEHVKVDGKPSTVVVDDAYIRESILDPFKKDYSWF